MNTDTEEIGCIYQRLISEGEELLQTLQKNHSNVCGIYKLHHKIKKDNKFLTESLLQNKIKKEHVACTNLHFYRGLVEELQNEANNPDAVLETFLYSTSKSDNIRLTVDIVSDKGQKWTKIIARNPTALQHIYKDGDGYGRRSILDQAKSYIEAASQNLCNYSPPQVTFSFINGVPEEMMLFLQRKGIAVKGNVLAVENDSFKLDSDDSEDEDYNPAGTCNDLPVFPHLQESTNKVNLCVTTMIAYVSSLTNDGCNKTFLEPLLNQQAEWERIRPVKPFLDSVFEGKVLIASSTAVEDFKKIMLHVGGEEENKRANDLLARIEVVPDIMFMDLKQSGQIKKRSLVIFGTGHYHRAITVTANKGFVHASKQKGIKFAVVVHESRALTEHKELPS